MAFKIDSTDSALTTPKPNTDIVNENVLDHQLHWARHNGRINNRAVVFVHGFTGDDVGTWESPRAATRFDSLILQDPDLKDYDVFSFAYKTTLLRGEDVAHLAKRLDQAIQELQIRGEKFGRHYHLVFLAHSLGGLVCMRYIIDQLQKNAAPPVLGMLLYGTPTTGTGLVSVAKMGLAALSLKLRMVSFLGKMWFKGQKQLDDLATASLFLTTLHDQWAARVVNGGNASSGAGRMWLPVRVCTGENDHVVSEHSAKGVYGAIDWQTLHYNHVELCKPDRITDDRYVAAKRFLEACRQSGSPELQADVWKLSQEVWNRRSARIVRELDFNTTIHAEPPHAVEVDSVLQTSGLSPILSHCTYKAILRRGPIRVGIAFGTGGVKEVWNIGPDVEPGEEPELIHTTGLNLLPDAERKQILDGLKAVMNGDPDEAWKKLCPKFRVFINDKELTNSITERNRLPPFEWLRRKYSLPAELEPFVEEEVTFRMEYQAVAPRTLNYFQFRHRWLTHGSKCKVTVNRDLDYLVPSQRLSTGQSAGITPSDNKQSVTFEVKETVLPGSGYEVSWWLALTTGPKTSESSASKSMGEA